ncbi:MAG: hypothetical protein AVDCRST_MAG02-3512, partial [uncultured Rubrobacteraceae bacterium]
EQHGVGARPCGGRVAKRGHREASQPELPPAVRRQPRGRRLRLAGAPVLPGFHAKHRGPERGALRAGGAGRGADAGARPDPGLSHQPGRRRKHSSQRRDPALRGRRAAGHGPRSPGVRHDKRAGRPDLAGHPLQPRRQTALRGRRPGPPEPRTLPPAREPQGEGL